MNEALLWMFLFQPMVDNQVSIEAKESTCTNAIYQKCSNMKNNKPQTKTYQKAIYNQPHSRGQHKAKIILG